MAQGYEINELAKEDSWRMFRIIGELVEGVRQMEEGPFGYARAIMYMQHDFSQPPMYQTLFKRWGLYEDEGGEEK